jgi:ketosteroid isomerase-like protein
MKIFWILLAFPGFLPLYLSAQTGDAQTIKNLNQDWLNSKAKKDSAALSKSLAADFVLIPPNDSKHTKKDNLLR